MEIIYEGPVVSAATPTAHRRRRKQQLRTAAGRYSCKRQHADVFEDVRPF